SLQTFFFKKEGVVKAVDGLDLEIKEGETVALVGESGSGKSVTALSIFRLVPPPGRIVGGRMLFQGRDLLELPEKQMATIRGRQMGLILQDPLSALNPVMRTGEQIAEVFRHHFAMKRKPARLKALELMERVQLPNPERLYKTYPHQLSGGQRQRALIAMALAGRPALVVADEPTTALDVSVQSQILALLQSLKQEFQLSLLLITHDLGIVAQVADRVAVMYAGKVVETAPTETLFQNPLHPYSQGLLEALPVVDFRKKDFSKNAGHFKWLNGGVPDLMNLPQGCAFHPRCRLADLSCRERSPENVHFGQDRCVRCLKAGKANENNSKILVG
ncbi:MAG: ABC transporter ATP-binding protein, partial [Calditrichaeota bacterium]